MLPVGMPGIDFASIQKAFKQGADVTVIGIRRGLDPVLNPPASLRVDGGTVMYYIGAQRLSSEDILRTVKALG
jgi:K+/H+ antiporter YhaU regulatory subunit KhtT